MRERHTHTHVSSTALLSCSLTADVAAARTPLAHSERESDGESKGTGERADMKDREYKCCPLYMPYKKEEGKREKWKERYLILHEQRRQGLFPLQWRRAVPTHTRAFISLSAAGCYIYLQRSLTVFTTTLSFFPSLGSCFICLLLPRCECDCTVGKVECKNSLLVCPSWFKDSTLYKFVAQIRLL